MKIIRSLWGKPNHQFKEKDLDFFHKECHQTKEIDEKYNLKNQMVMVWDEINRELMETLGYSYHYMGESSDMGIEYNFLHKLLALKKSMELYDEVLFLDWDFHIQKPLDQYFFDTLKNGNDIQIPLYYYPKELMILFQNMELNDKNVSNYYNNLHQQMITHCKWNFEDGLVIPNAGFIYCRDKHFINSIVDIQKKHNITTNIEEICSMIYFNNTINGLEEYLEKIEPVVCNGKIGSEMMGKQILLNNYTTEKLNKNIYFIHD